MVKNGFYFSKINKIGGAETYLYYIAKKYKDNDICIYYSEGDEKQIERLKKYVRVKHWNLETIECEKMFYNYNPEPFINYVNAKEHIQVLHTNYKKMGLKPSTNKKITKYIGVSKYICNETKKDFGIECELSYNPIDIDKPKKPLRLICASRLSSEKGKNRINKFCRKFDEANIPFILICFSDDERAINHDSVIFAKSRLDISNFIADSDYLVQLSDDVEGFGYSPYEALCLGTPVIVTDVTAFKEMGIKNGENGYIVDFDLENINCKEIYEKRPKFDYKPLEDNYKNILAKGESSYMKDFEKKVEVEAIINPFFYDIELKENKPLGAKYIVNKNRADDLVEKGLVKIVREIEEEKLKKRTRKAK